MMVRRRGRLPGPPIWTQILALLIGGLVAAQLVTLGLTILLPPEPPQRHSLEDIARALHGGALQSGDARPLMRSVASAPPSLQSPGWAVSPPATRALASLLGVGESDVRLLFYAPPPLAGTAAPPPRGLPPLPNRSADDAAPRPVRLAGFVLAQDGPPPGVQGRPRAGNPGAGGHRAPRVERSAPAHPSMPAAPDPPGGRFPPQTRPTPSGPGGDRTIHRLPRSPAADRWAPRAVAPVDTPRPPTVGPPPAARDVPFPGLGWLGPERGPTIGPPPLRLDGPILAQRGEVLSPPSELPPRAASGSGTGVEAPPDVALAPRETLAIAAPAAAATATSSVPLAPPVAPSLPETAEVAAPVADEPVGAPLPAPDSARGLFGMVRAPYVAGEFVAALRLADGQWVSVRPQPEGFPNSWQQRVLLWFVLSLALVAPLGYLMARRLAAPLNRFADAAEQLGRDPSADIDPLDGPAEVGRAAEAFNQMQRRLKRYVEDRTSMVGAISHDLRTPLARMRFKLERAPPALQAALDRDIAQMEQMITSVLSFMRDEAAVGERRRIDLRSVLECAVDEAGGPVALLDGASVEVEADPLTLQRVFDNLIGNAVKYGLRADVSLRVEQDEAVVQVADEGPGMSDAELAQAFLPFHRGDGAKASGKSGMGLGLTVSRSAVRAHGGDLTLRNGPKGLVAEVRLPLSRRRSLAA